MVVYQGENLVQVGVGRVKNPLLCLRFLSVALSVLASGCEGQQLVTVSAVVAGHCHILTACCVEDVVV